MRFLRTILALSVVALLLPTVAAAQTTSDILAKLAALGTKIDALAVQLSSLTRRVSALEGAAKPTEPSSPPGQVPPGNLYIATDSSSPSLQTTSPGSTNIVAGVAHLRASGEPMKLSRVGLKLSQGLPTDLSSVSVWYQGQQIASALFGSATNATATIANPITLPQDFDVLLTIKANFPAALGKDQDRIILNLVDGPSTQAVGVWSGKLINATGGTNFPGVVVMTNPVPVITTPEPQNPPVQTVTLPSPQAHWTFKESLTSPTESTVARNSVTLVPTGAHFTPKAWLVGEDSPAVEAKDMTISAYVTPESYPSDGRAYIVAKGLSSEQNWSSYQLFFDGAGKLHFMLQNKTQNAYPHWTSNASIPVGSPSHVTVTAQRTSTGYDVKMYINGSVTGTVLTPNGYDPNKFVVEYSTGRFYIGSPAYQDANYFSGTISDLYFFGSALSEQQIQYLSGQRFGAATPAIPRQSMAASILGLFGAIFGVRR